MEPCVCVLGFPRHEKSFLFDCSELLVIPLGITLEEQRSFTALTTGEFQAMDLFSAMEFILGINVTVRKSRRTRE